MNPFNDLKKMMENFLENLTLDISKTPAIFNHPDHETGINTELDRMSKDDRDKFFEENGNSDESIKQVEKRLKRGNNLDTFLG